MNVVLYAFRKDADRHDDYRQWLEDLINREAAYGMSPQVLCSVIRISTNARIYREPSRIEEALNFCRALTEQPNCVLVQPGERHWSIFVGLAIHTGAAGNLVQDAWLAALAIESGSEWVTTDHDYARFPALRWRPPFR